MQCRTPHTLTTHAKLVEPPLAPADCSVLCFPSTALIYSPSTPLPDLGLLLPWAISPGPSPSTLRSFPLDFLLEPRSLFPCQSRLWLFVFFCLFLFLAILSISLVACCSLLPLLRHLVGRSFPPNPKTPFCLLLSYPFGVFGLLRDWAAPSSCLCLFSPFLPSHILCPPYCRSLLPCSLVYIILFSSPSPPF